MKKNFKFFNLILVVFILLLAISSTFAWFFINKQIEVEYGSEIVCEAGTSLEVSLLEGFDVDNNLELWSEYSSYVKYIGKEAKIEDITGDGMNLYRPTGIETDPDTKELYPGGLSTANKIDDSGFGDYIELELKFRSTSEMNVYLSGESIVEPIDSSDTNRNIFGKFSKDFIAGAIRVAILEKNDDGSEELKMIWAPNPNIELIKEDNIYELEDEEGTIETYYYYKYDENENKILKYKVSSEDYANKLFVIGSTNTTEAMVNNSPILTSINSSVDQIVEKRIIIRVWFEGTDREADQALSGGQVKVNLKFVGMLGKEEHDSSVQELINSISFVSEDGAIVNIENITEDILYSIDGYTWLKSNENNITTLINNINNRTEEMKVYFKYQENERYYEYMTSHTFEYVSGGETNE